MTEIQDPETIELKNSIKWNAILLLGTLTLSLFLLSNSIKTQTTSWGTIVFCLLLIAYPTFKLLNRRPQLTISKDGLLFKNGEFRQWTEIDSAVVEEINDDLPSFRLKVQLANGKTLKIKLTDLNHNKDYIIKIIDDFKKNAC